MDGYGWDGMGWDLCAGLLYEHRFAMLIIREVSTSRVPGWEVATSSQLCFSAGSSIVCTQEG